MSSPRPRLLPLVSLLFAGCAAMPEVQPIRADLPAATAPGVTYALPKTEILVALPVVQTAHTRAPLLPEHESEWADYARELYAKLGVKPGEIELQTVFTYRLVTADAAIATRAVPDPAAVFQVGLITPWPLQTKLTLKLDSSMILFSADTTSANQALGTALKVAETAVSIGAMLAVNQTTAGVADIARTAQPTELVGILHSAPNTITSAGGVAEAPAALVRATKTPVQIAIDEVLRLRAQRRKFLETAPLHHDAGQLQLALAWLAQEEARHLALLTGTTETKTWTALAKFVPAPDHLVGGVATLHETFGLEFDRANGLNADLNPFGYHPTTKGPDGVVTPTLASLASIGGKTPATWRVEQTSAQQFMLSVKVDVGALPYPPEKIAEPAATDRSYAYRVPATCVVSALQGATVFVQKETPVPQLGLTRFLPRRLDGISGSLNFALNPETGALTTVTSEATAPDVGAAVASLGENAKTILTANDELTRLTREQKILEAKTAIKTARDALK